MLKEFKKHKLLLVLLFLIELAGSLNAQSSFWEKTTGLVNVRINSIVSDDNGTLYIGTNGSGVYKSTDDGKNWTELNNGITTKNINALIINNQGHLIAGTAGGGILKLTNFSGSWVKSSTGISNLYINTIVKDNYGILYIGTSGGGIFKSTDNGQNWVNINDGLKNLYVYSLGINKSGHIYAGAVGVFKSTDEGITWNDARTGLPTTYIFSIAVDSSGYIYSTTNVDGVYRSTDEGGSWVKVNSGLTKYDVRSIIVNPSRHIYVGTKGGGIFRSINSGENWSAVNDGLTNSEVFSFCYKPTGFLFAGTSSGVFKSSLPMLTPVVSTDPATNVTNNTATLNGKINANNIVTSAKFQYGTTTGYGNEIVANPSSITGSANTPVTANLQNLQSKTLYHFRLVGATATDTYYGNNQTFTTTELPPVIKVAPASLDFYADRNGELPEDKSILITKANSTTLNWTVSDNRSWLDVNPKSGIDSGIVNVSITNTNLSPGTYTGQITVSATKAQNTPQYVTVNYIITDRPVISVNPSELKFEELLLKSSKTLKVIISNKGSLELQISNMKITGSDSSDFVITNKKTFPYAIGSGSTDTVFIKFTPYSIGAKSSVFSIYHNAVNGVSNINLSGKGNRPFLAAPVLSKPINNSKDISTNPVLMWNPVAGATGYTYQIAVDSVFTPLIRERKDVKETRDVVIDLLDNTLYYWRVAASDSLGEGSWSDIWKFSTVINIPSIPVLSSPSNNASSISLEPVLSWIAVRSAESYNIQVAEDSSFSPNLYDMNNISSASCQIKNLKTKTRYFWRVSATNSIGTGKWSGIYNFETIDKINRILLSGLDSQVCILNGFLENPIKVKIIDQSNNPAPGIRVVFDFVKVPSGSTGYFLSTNETITDVNGESSILLKVGAKPGIYIISASVPGTTIKPVNITVIAQAGKPKNIFCISGDNQEAEVNTTLKSPLRIKVTDSLDNPVENTIVKFSFHGIPSGTQGQLIIYDSLTDKNGEISAILKFGNIIGEYLVKASALKISETNLILKATAIAPEYPAVLTLDTTGTKFAKYPKLSDYKSKDWRIIGLPGASNKLISEFVSGVQNEDWQIYWDNGAASNYLVKFDGSSKFIDSVGKAFWLLSRNDWKIKKFIPSAPLSQNNEVNITLRNGWNLITNPFTVSIPWSRIQNVNNTNSPIFSFNGEWDTSSMFVPFTGYLFDNVKKLKFLKIPYNLLFTNESDKLHKEQHEWTINVSLHSDEFLDKTLWFGVTNSQVSNFKKPRATVDLPTSYFYHPEWDTSFSAFSTDIKENSNELKRWEFIVQTRISSSNKLIFTGINDIPAENRAILVDEIGLKYFDLRRDSVYLFTAKSFLTKFKVLIGKDDEIRKQIEELVFPVKYEIGKSYPNPFNSSTSFPLFIPKITFIKLSIYDILGREVKNLFTGYLEGGEYLFNWDGVDYTGKHSVSGIYFIRLNTNEGVNLINRIVLIK